MRRPPARALGRAVARPVVDEEELEGRADGLHRRDDARRQRLDVPLLVEDGNDDAVGQATAAVAGGGWGGALGALTGAAP